MPRVAHLWPSPADVRGYVEIVKDYGWYAVGLFGVLVVVWLLSKILRIQKGG